ncbi:furin-like protease 1, isoforms 1/1-X/2 isoform X1 [Musca autumnalis]|uniref:furin-like protease 1, isoforms 1/1-X/2 isoform X1 n=1 Tax=Musca autumnalis TaxID=221902 RepID=UPI003CF23AEE
MKNDVVRWPVQKCKKTCSNLNDNQKHCKFPDNSSSVTSHSTTFPSSTFLTGSCSQSLKCDTLNNNIYLVKDVNRHKCWWEQQVETRLSWHYYLKALQYGRGSNRCCSWFTYLFQICIAIFLCSLNVGFATCTAMNSVTVVDVNSLPYELDYTESVSSAGNHYTHTWAVHIPNGDIDSKADVVAQDHGFVNMGKIFEDHYLFAHHKVSKRSLEPSTHHQTRLDEDARVNWAKQQIAKSRRKRDFIRMRPSRTSSRSAFSRVKSMPFTDPKWEHMWYLNRGGDLDMNVIPAWKEGITGKGIVVTILDDGLESDHPDIIHNYDPKASYDVNSLDEDPMPHYDLADSNRHGTRCAGEVAATANNSICAVGIAFGASVGGVRMLDGDVTDAVEARSLSLNPQHIDIYSASWGPDDDGKTVDGPGELASRAFIEGVTKGRAGKGSIFIWASGNGGREMDNCNCDGYTNSIWTLSISSATEDGFVPWYSEKCSSTLATTYSSGSQAEKQVVTTDLHHSCTVSHTGTSASAPLAAGIAALVLESNKNLTWRDMQHIVVRTAKPANLIDPTWSKNGVGRRVSHSFGYGLMDAAAMVRLARQWKTVPEQQRCEINAPHVDKVIPPKSHITLQLSVKNCLNINFLEHVQAKITLTSQRRGDIQLNLISPAGTKVTLLTPRVHDTSHSGFNQWPFMSVHTWGESPHGNWQLEIHNEGRYMGHALLREWSLIFYGTTQSIDPNDPVSTPRTNFDITTPNSSSTTTSLYQIYSAQYPRIPPNNFVSSKLGSSGKFTSNKLSVSPSNILNNFAVPNATLNQVIVANKKITTKQGSASQNNKNAKQNKNFKARPQESAKTNKNSNSNKAKSKENSPTSTQTPKNKFYRISQQGKTSLSKLVSPSENVKTKIAKIQQPNERLQTSFDIKTNRKVVGDLPISNSKKTITSGSGESNAKSHAKATKQVKNLVSTKSPMSTTEISVTKRIRPASVQSNQRITKLFERYEKIQSIFPEFQPYQPGLKDQKENGTKKEFEQLLKSNHSTSQSINVSSIQSGSFTKPSRENTRKLSSSFVPDQNILKKQQLLLAAAGVSGGTQRPVTSTQRKIYNAQITQWDLIFYGTEEPAQPDDPFPLNSNKLNSFAAEAERNDVEYDSESQWRDMQKLSESGTMNHDRTNTSCLKATINLRCLVCAPPTFFYRGRCYDMCPSHTYIARGQMHDDITNNNLTSHEMDYEELQANDRRKRNRGASGIGASDDNKRPLSCEPCDKSCFNCFGPLNSECETCFSGSQLKIMPHTNESYCINFSERSSGNAVTNQTTHSFHIAIFLIFVVPSVIIIMLVVLWTKSEKSFNICTIQRKDGNESSVNYSYDRVALMSDEEAPDELD